MCSSIEHAMINKATECFWIPEDVPEIFMKYRNRFQITLTKTRFRCRLTYVSSGKCSRMNCSIRFLLLSDRNAADINEYQGYNDEINAKSICGPDHWYQ